MRHPTEGVLRRLLDDPAGVSDPDRAHVLDCAHCLADLDGIRTDARLAGAALQSQPGTTDVDAAWARLSSATAIAGAAPRTPRAQGGRLRALLRRPVVPVAAVAVVLAGAGTAAANDWLQIFRTEQVATVSLRTADLLALPDLTAYGDLVVSQEADVREVADAATAAAQTGLDVPEVAALPRGVVGDPVYQVGSKVSATFTFSAEQARRAASADGRALPPPPPGLDGSSVRLVAGPGVAQIWSSGNGAPALLVGRAVAPTAFSSSGLPFETLRDYLLSLPGLPPDVAAQLRRFAADGSTLPLPVPADQVDTSSTQVDGLPATVLTTRDRTLAAVVWVDEGIVTVVAGSLDDDEVLTVAEELR